MQEKVVSFEDVNRKGVARGIEVLWVLQSDVPLLVLLFMYFCLQQLK